MTKDGTRKGVWAAGAVFAAFSVAVALGCLYGVDLWVLRTAQERPSGFLDSAFGIFSLLGGVEIIGAMLLVLLAGLFVRGRGYWRDGSWLSSS